MEDDKSHHHHHHHHHNNNNLLHLNLPSSSSPSNSHHHHLNHHLLHETNTLLGLFNSLPSNHHLPTFPLINTNTSTPSPFSTFQHQHPPFTGYGFQDSSEISPSCSTTPQYDTRGAVDHHPHHKIKPNGVMGGKRRKMVMNKKGEAAMEKLPREVIHVRAKRGQATDSHSLAERVRRDRINDKLKVLQDLVPGCYKTMGMAVMLDVIIHYVQSLQNQIEFLSMKLSAASMFYDFNSPEAEAMESLQRANPCEAMEMETMLMRDEGFDQGLASSTPAPADGHDHSLHSTWPF